MNNYQKQLVLSGVRELEKANKIIKQLVGQKEKQKMVDFLCECQNVAIEIGNYLERIGKAQCTGIKLLEEYCELLYCLSVCEQEEKDKIIKKLSYTVDEFKTEINYRTRTMKEVVFLPYKAAMWDSMESVYESMREDEMFDCHVVPIPYFNKAATGELKDETYEANLFPKDIMVESYLEYSIEDRRPDIVVIHNAYDDSNYVTSIHPDFYSTRLKEYVDVLVYIPYFVTVGTVKEHYCVSPGVLMADIVIVQSEEVRKRYAEVYQKFLYDNDLVEYLIPANKKFVVGGSPKFDKIRENKKIEENEIPVEWLQILRDNEKPVILFNTHLSGVMEFYAERFFEKLENTLEVFKNRNDVVLLWRPHPLTEDTAIAMNPLAIQKYRSIVDKYKSEKWGIYDDTADLYRAIKLSDAYYGSQSSLIALFKEMKKPVLIQNNSVLYEVT